MTREKKEISKDIYDRAMQCGSYIFGEDRNRIFTDSQLYGFGIYSAIAVEENGKYYCIYQIGDSCE